ncbi:TerB family tellurite resistance protein [uncultured Litoreibacter sp.]|uniref:tellurite resistance TerB family protein n=1 Tax=uncultured Litoreibacter sp. TaxID=1392394 RepID=UPI00260BC557|nr:TerB family tellurite resistance protein [uncultured Litoreibacter sp.]
MFEKWFKRTSPEAPPLPTPTAELSLGALLVRMAKADKNYHVTEIGVVDRVLASQFDLTSVEAARMRADCERLEKAAPDTAQFIALINSNIPTAQRRALLKALADVARADGIDHPEEEALIQVLATELDAQYK